MHLTSSYRGVAIGAILYVCAAATGQSFINWESPHVTPASMTPDGTKLLVVNTADNRLEVFSVTESGLSHGGHLSSVPVGLDPVSVRARTDTEAWVVNQISDSVSIVDLDSMTVVRTLNVGDEPSDVVFAGSPQRAFVSLALPGVVKVYDPENLNQPPAAIAIQGHRPKALATDGNNVYAAIFEAGNLTTIIDEFEVSSNVNPYPGNPNPPPNAGAGFEPPIALDLPNPPATSLIVKKHPDGSWRDDNFADWSAAVDWDLHGHDVAVINAGSLDVSYVTGLMNLNMHLAVSSTGQVMVVGTEALNHIRFEPNIRGTFLRVNGGVFPAGGGVPTIADLNPHLDYSTFLIPRKEREQSIGDPRGVAWNASGSRAYITGMGSNNLIAVDQAMNRQGLVAVGEGPTGVIVDDERGHIYVVNKFEATVSVIVEETLSEIQRIGFYDPTPPFIAAGRKHLYDTHHSSGLGHTSCASCHVDGRMDQIAWDLGDPQGEMKPFNQLCNVNIPLAGQCEDWHPMKGPMTTQTLQGIIGTEPLHWRGDREDLAAFNPAFSGLLGRETGLTDEEMEEFTDLVASLRFPPNPNRNIDNSLRTSLFNGGNPANGEHLFLTMPVDAGLVTCNACHSVPTGTTGELTSANLLLQAQSFKVPQLRNMHEKVGFFKDSQENDRGFGYLHDGRDDTLFNFLQFPGFFFSPGNAGNQQRRDIEAFMLSFSVDTHAGVGVQTTVDSPRPGNGQLDLIQLMISMAEAREVGLVVKGMFLGEHRGFAYFGGGTFQSDREVETYALAELIAAVSPDSALTFTIVPYGSQMRIGIDRDLDGFYDRDELDAGSDPADPNSVPGDSGVPGDLNGDGVVDVFDLLILLGAWGACDDVNECPADLNGDGFVDVFDLLLLLSHWG